MSDAVLDLRAELQAALEGDYVVERELGRGGMGAVFLARDVRLDRPVAIKVLPPELAVRSELRERFLRETRTAASFSHPNIVPVHAVEVRDDLLCFVMGFVEGESLAERLRRAGSLSTHEAVRLLQEVAWALSYAHGRGVVHRDIKPDNILIERATGRAMVMDFGIARSSAASALTTVGDVVGTPQFMSPEQASGDVIDGRSDLYSLGVVGFCAVTGHVPFNADSTPAILAMQITRIPPPVATERPDLSPALAAAIDRCLAKAPEDRFQTGEALAEALDAVRSTRTEVAPVIRLFQQKSATLIRNAFIITMFLWMLLSRKGSAFDQFLSLLLIATAACSLILLALLGLRDLARQGFSFGEVESGLGSIAEEGREAVKQSRMAPDWAARRQRRIMTLIGSSVATVLLFAFSMSRRHPVPGQPGMHSTTAAGALAITLAVIVGMGTIIFWAGSGSKSGKMDSRISKLFTGASGRMLYRVMSRGISRPSGHGASVITQAQSGARTIYERLPRRLKRPLRFAEPAMQQLERAESACRDRLMSLERAEGDARSGTAGGSASADERDALVRELQEARAEAEAHLASLLQAGESLRLALVRAESGLSSAEGVTGVIARIEGLPRP